MKCTNWVHELRSAFGKARRRRDSHHTFRPLPTRQAFFEPLEQRALLAVDFGDAPDMAPGTGVANYQTLASDNGPQHTIVVGLKMGAGVDGDGGALQNAAANADDVNAALPDDEDGLVNPAADLVVTIGAQPTVSVRVTNTTGADATLYGWIDYNANGVFENVAERTSAPVPKGTDNGIVTLVFPATPNEHTGATYARFRLSTDSAAANAIGAAMDGEVEDYAASMLRPSTSEANSATTVNIAMVGPGPFLKARDFFGSAVASIGDIDGDGVSDLAVGAAGEVEQRGAVHILFMNANGTVKGSQRIAHNEGGGPTIGIGNEFGSAVAALGDLDGDGISELAVGAFFDGTGGRGRGAVHVLFLNANGTVKALQKIAHNFGGGPTLSNDDYFGSSVTAIGDLDGNGVTEIAVGAIGDDAGGEDRGAVYVLWMNPNGSVNSTQKISSTTGGGPALKDNDYFGSSLTSIGDLDGDGVTDIAVGAFQDQTGGFGRGAVHVLFMNVNGTAKSSRKIASGTGGGPMLADNDHFGRSVANIGDVDGDGITDLAVGAERDGTGGIRRGAVYVAFMSADGTAKGSLKIGNGVGGGPTLMDDDEFGTAVASLGDVDVDGVPDLLVGVPFDDSGGEDRGAVHILRLNSGGVAIGDTKIASINLELMNNDELGSAVVAIGDLDGDGVTDLAVGAPLSRTAGANFGGVHVLLMNPDGSYKSTKEITHNRNGGPTFAAGEYFGNSLAALGDLDGDGIPDLAVGAPRGDTGGSDRGSVYVLLMNADGSAKALSKIAHNFGGGPSLANDDRFGVSLAAIGDFDGDGVTDLAAGAYRDSVDGILRGAIYVLLMNPNGTAKGRHRIASGVNGGPVLADSDLFGASIAAIGDLDGDGVPELAVGAVGDDTGFGALNRGAVHVLFMNSNGTVKGSQKIASGTGGGPTLANNDRFGISIASLGDLNGDGVPDLGVGAEWDDMGGTNRGIVHVLYMNANGTVESSQKIGDNTGGGPVLSNGDYFGSSVASLGDLDGDGVTDLAIGARGGNGPGAAYVMFLTGFVNANPVITTPETVSVAENTTGVITLTATDADVPAQTVKFSIVGGADADKFALTDGGALSFIQAPDFEAPSDADCDNIYIVAVQANDGHGGTATQITNVIVTPVNETAPVFTSPSAASVPENATTVMTVTAADSDLPPQALTFSIVGGADASRFVITSDGALSFNAPRDFEVPTDANGDNVYVVTVRASDGEGGMATQTINVTVTPVNDNAPAFTSPNMAIVLENSTAILTVTAVDADLPAQSVTYSIDEVADFASFAITGNGVLSFSTAPDFEAPTDANGDNVYVVVVQATDGALTSIQAILVTVTPVNDNSPVFTTPDAASIPENTTAIMTVSATDADRPAQEVTYSIVGGADAARFAVTNGGALSFIAPPDFEAPTDADGDNVYVVTVQASDGNGRTTAQTISVAVMPPAMDFGDAPDIALGTGAGNYQTSLADNGPRHSVVASLKLGASVDGDDGTLHGNLANADDVDGALPDDEDGLVNPAADLALVVGAQPTVGVRVTNIGGSAATVYGWIDYNADGVLDNATERASAAVPAGTNNAVVTLVFPAVPAAFAGTTYARFRLSTDAAAANPTGEASDGEVEDYRATITRTTFGTADSDKTQKIGDNAGGGPSLADVDFFGGSAASIGDLDGDGVTDIAVGAFQDQTGGFGRGAVHVLFMNPNGTVKSLQKIAHETGGGPSLENNDFFGRSVTALGDLDGDGVVDLAVGADRDDAGGANRGAVYVLFMNADGTAKSSRKIASGVNGGPGLQTNGYFGIATAPLGDMDGDGVADLAVGAFQDATGGAQRGAVYVLFLNSDGTAKASQKIAHNTGGGPSLVNQDFFGRSVASLGDLDGDGVSDLAVGAVGDDLGGANRGAVHVLFMNANGTAKSTQKIASSTGGGPILANDDQFGFSLASPGDLDGDGVADLAVGANYDDAGGDGRGAVHVLFLTSAGTAKSAQKIASGVGGGPTLGDGDAFGSAIASLGDLDGDGVADLAVGAERDGAGAINRGAVYVLFLEQFNTAPVITSPNTASVVENTTGVLTVTATDSDLPAQTVTFTIAGGADAAQFAITGGGALSFKAPPDFEAPTDEDADNVYEVIVEASDGRGGAALQTVSVAVTPVNDNSPAFTSPEAVSVPENASNVLTVTAADADQPPQAISYSIIGGADAGKLAITAGGALSFVSPPDFEAPSDANGDNVFVVIVQASDGSRTSIQALVVSVTPVNEAAPAFTSPAAVSVVENTTAVATVSATDADLPVQPVTYSIVGGADLSRFAMTTAGALSFVTPPDFDAPADANGDNVYEVEVRADDNNGKSTVQAISVTVTPPPAAFGDFDSSGVVDGADLVVWREQFGMAGGGPNPADSDDDRDVDGADFLTWQRNVGLDRTSPASANSGAASDASHEESLAPALASMQPALDGAAGALFEELNGDGVFLQDAMFNENDFAALRAAATRAADRVDSTRRSFDRAAHNKFRAEPRSAWAVFHDRHFNDDLSDWRSHIADVGTRRDELSGDDSGESKVIGWSGGAGQLREEHVDAAFAGHGD